MTTTDIKDKWVAFLPDTAKLIVGDVASSLPTKQERDTHPKIPEPKSEQAKNESLRDEWNDWYKRSDSLACKRFLTWLSENTARDNTSAETLIAYYISFYVHIHQYYFPSHTTPSSNNPTSDHCTVPSDITVNAKSGHLPLSPSSTLQSPSTYYLTSNKNVELAASVVMALRNILDKKPCNLQEVTCVSMLYYLNVPSLSYLDIPPVKGNPYGFLYPFQFKEGGSKSRVVGFKADTSTILQWSMSSHGIFEVSEEGDTMVKTHRNVLKNAIMSYHNEDSERNKKNYSFIKLYPVFAAMQLTYKWSEKEWVSNTWKKDDQDAHIPLSPEHPAFVAFWINYEQIVNHDYGSEDSNNYLEKLQTAHLKNLNSLYESTKVPPNATARRTTSIASSPASLAASTSPPSTGHFLRNISHPFNPAVQYFMDTFQVLAAIVEEKLKKPKDLDEERETKRPRINNIDSEGVFCSRWDSAYQKTQIAALGQSITANEEKMWEMANSLGHKLCVVILGNYVPDEQRKRIYEMDTEQQRLQGIFNTLGIITAMTHLTTLFDNNKELNDAKETKSSS